MTKREESTMTTLTPYAPYPPYSITEMNRLRDQAHAEAHLLREQAVRDFWRGVDHLLRSATFPAERAARRLAARLGRRNPAPLCANGVEALR